jgi:RNA polymerase sigma factor (sigma-70 family)
MDAGRWLDTHILVHEASLRTYLNRFFASAADVADAIHDTYAKLLMLGDAERTAIRSPQAYLFGTARHVALDRLRRHRVVSLETLTEIERHSVLGYAQPPDHELNDRQEFALLVRAIASLPERCRQVMSLRALYGLPQKEIAKRLGMAEHTVEKHLGQGIRLCTQRMIDGVTRDSPCRHRAAARNRRSRQAEDD